jgi:hypothetical protein
MISAELLRKWKGLADTAGAEACLQAVVNEIAAEASPFDECERAMQLLVEYPGLAHAVKQELIAHLRRAFAVNMPATTPQLQSLEKTRIELEREFWLRRGSSTEMEQLHRRHAALNEEARTLDLSLLALERERVELREQLEQFACKEARE